MRCDCRYGACGPPTSGPSSQSKPSQRIESRSWLYDSSESRAASVSSMRKTSVPWWCRANAQLNRAVRTRPTWGLPVGEGQKRTRTGALATLDNLVGESADAFDGDGDLVADGERPDACRGAREDHVAGEQRHGLGDVDDQILDSVDHLAGAAELALFAVDGELDRQVGGRLQVQVRLHPRAERAGGVEALGPRPLLLALLDVTGGDVVRAGVAEDHVLDALARHLAAHPADDDGEFGLVMDVRREGGVLDLVAGADHRGGGLEEGEGDVRDLVAQFLRVVGVVAAVRHDLVGQHRRQQTHLVDRDLRTGELEVRERDALDDVEDELVRPVPFDRAEGDVPVDGESGDAHGFWAPLYSAGWSLMLQANAGRG